MLGPLKIFFFYDKPKSDFIKFSAVIIFRVYDYDFGAVNSRCFELDFLLKLSFEFPKKLDRKISLGMRKLEIVSFLITLEFA